MTSLNWHSEKEAIEAKGLEAREIREITDSMSNGEIVEQWALRKTRDPIIFKALIKGAVVKRK